MKRLIVGVVAVFLCMHTAMAEEKKPDGEATKAAVHQDMKKAAVHHDMLQKTVKPVTANEETLAKYKDLIKAYQDYWDAIMKRDFKATYEMEASEFKKKVSYDLYEERHKKMVAILGVKPIDVKQTDEREVVVRGLQVYRIKMNMESAKGFDDIWIKEGDAYKHLKTETKKTPAVKTDVKGKIKKAAETQKADETKNAAETKEVVR